MDWWLKDQKRWQHEETEMSTWFPLSQWGERQENGIPVRFWEVIVEPIPIKEELPLILVDLEKDRTVDIEVGGKIRHSMECIADHTVQSAFESITIDDEAYLVELVYNKPPRFPRARCLDPNWSKQTLPEHEHFYSKYNGEIICPLFPPDNSWQWSKNTAADYLTAISLWILKTVVWINTKNTIGEGIWLGTAAEHSIASLLRVHPDLSCPCGSGKKYRHCCLRKNVQQLRITQPKTRR